MVAEKVTIKVSAYLPQFKELAALGIEQTKQARRLATRYHVTVSDMVKTVGLEQAYGEFKLAMENLESWFKKENPGTTLSDEWPNHRQYKSDYLTGLKKGMNPLDYPSFSAFKLAKRDFETPDSSEEKPTQKTTGKKGSKSAKPDVTNVVQLLPDKVSVKGQTLMQHAFETFNALVVRNEAEALRILQNFEWKMSSTLKQLSKGNKKVLASTLNKGGDKAAATG